MNSNLPIELQLTDEELSVLSIADVQRLFKIADEYGVGEQFAAAFWPAMSRVRSNPINMSMQKCVDYLEERKRSIGRAYNIAKQKAYSQNWLAKYQAIRYNEVEYHIQWLTKVYGCTRKSKEYTLDV